MIEFQSETGKFNSWLKYYEPCWYIKDEQLTVTYPTDLFRVLGFRDALGRHIKRGNQIVRIWDRPTHMLVVVVEPTMDITDFSIAGDAFTLVYKVMASDKVEVQ